MGMIIKDHLPALKVGYPVETHQCNVFGATLAGEKTVKFGQLVGWREDRYVEALEAVTDTTNIAGIVVATNVKLADWPANEVFTYPGEALNVLRDGYIAVELATNAVEDKIIPNGKVYVTDTAEFTTEETTTEYATFTGTYEYHGDRLVAEIYVR